MKLEQIPIARYPLPSPVRISFDKLGMTVDEVEHALRLIEEDGLHHVRIPLDIAVERTTLWAFGQPARRSYVRDDR